MAAGSMDELKRELSAFDDKVTRMERSMQQVSARVHFRETIILSDYFDIMLLCRFNYLYVT